MADPAPCLHCTGSYDNIDYLGSFILLFYVKLYKQKKSTALMLKCHFICCQFIKRILVTSNLKILDLSLFTFSALGSFWKNIYFVIKCGIISGGTAYLSYNGFFESLSEHWVWYRAKMPGLLNSEDNRSLLLKAWKERGTRFYTHMLSGTCHHPHRVASVLEVDRSSVIDMVAKHMLNSNHCPLSICFVFITTWCCCHY